MKVTNHPDFLKFRGREIGAVFQSGIGDIQVRRIYVTPSNPQTVAQTLARDAFGSLSIAYRNLSAVQLAAWAALALFYPRTTIGGQSYPMTALACFNMVNSFRTLRGLAVDLVAPADPTVTGVGAITMNIGSVTRDIELQAVDTDVGAALYRVRITQITPVPYTLDFNKTRYCTTDLADSIISATPGTGVVDLNILAADVRADWIDTAAAADGDRFGVSILKLGADYAPQTAEGTFQEVITTEVV